MKLWSLFLLVVVSLLVVIPASAQEMRCVVGTAVVMNGAIDQTEDVSGGIIYEYERQLYRGPLGAAVEVLAGNEATVQTPNTFIPVDALFVEMYLGGALETGILDLIISSCDAAPAAGGAAPTFIDGRLNANGSDTAVVFGSVGSYAVWGVDPNGTGFAAFTFTCVGLQETLSGAPAQANGNYLLDSIAAPGRNGDIQLWAVPGSGGSLALVLVSPGQGGDNSKQTIVPLSGLCPNLTVT